MTHKFTGDMWQVAIEVDSVFKHFGKSSLSYTPDSGKSDDGAPFPGLFDLVYPKRSILHLQSYITFRRLNVKYTFILCKAFSKILLPAA